MEGLPIIYLDYSLVDYKNGKATFQKSLLNKLGAIAQQYELRFHTEIIQDYFTGLVMKLAEKFGQVVVLIDECDKPMIDVLTKKEQFNENREIL